jgi:hypothetical protein
MEWARIPAYITGTVDQELLLRNEYLAAENRILKARLRGRLSLSDGERATLGEIGYRLGRRVLGEVATAALPESHCAPERAVDAASSSERDHGWVRCTSRLSLSFARLRREVLCLVSGDNRNRPRQGTDLARAKSQSECLRGTLDKICKRRVFVEDHSLWRTLLAAGDERIC